MSAAVAEAKRHAAIASEPQGDGAGGALAGNARGTNSSASAPIAHLRRVVETATGAAPTRPVELRQSITDLAGAIRGVLIALGLPEIDGDAAHWWRLVVPVSEALQHADSIVAAAPRSSRSLSTAHQTLLSAAAALADPDANAERPFSFAHVAVAVPGPAGFATGTFETDVVGRYKGVYWAPDAGYATHALGQLAGRPEGFRYRWEDKRVWEQLAHDMIVVSCGWLHHPKRVPPALGRGASARLGQQLRQDLGTTSEWAVHAAAIVRWLARTGTVTAVGPLPELAS